MGTRSKRVQYCSAVSLRVGTMQLHKLCKHASELEWSGGRRGRAEAEGVGGSQRWAEKGKGGCTMTVTLGCTWAYVDGDEASSPSDTTGPKYSPCMYMLQAQVLRAVPPSDQSAWNLSE